MRTPEVVVSDTSCLIILSKISELDLLHQLFSKVLVPEIVAQEFGEILPEWISIQNPNSANLRALNNLGLGPGEHSAFALALETDALVIVDENFGRKVADRLNLRYIGTLGILNKAKQKGLVYSVRALIDKIQATNFRMSNAVIMEALSQAGELESNDRAQ